jgi:hypothetical protein
MSMPSAWAWHYRRGHQRPAPDSHAYQTSLQGASFPHVVFKVLAIPFVALALAQYLRVGYKANSVLQHPERLYLDKKLMLVVSLAFVACVSLLFIDIPWLSHFFDPIETPPQ